MRNQLIRIHVDAPAKPAEGEACNGCGVCCSASPCPMGVVLSRRFSGACVALRWHDDGQRYRCAMVDDPAQVLGSLPPWLARQAARLAGRWIAAGIGCDCSLEAAPQAEVDDAVTQRPARDGHEPRRTRA